MNKLLAITASLLFILSFFLTAFYYEDNGAHVPFPGHMCYLWTFPGIFAHLCAWPNVLMPLAVIVSLSNGKSKMLTVLCAVVACLCIPLSLSFLTHSEMMVKDTSGTNQIVSLGAGFYVWMGMQAVLCLFLTMRACRVAAKKTAEELTSDS